MNYVKSLDLFGVEVQQIPNITGSGAPTTATEGAVGCLYMDTASENGDMYKCIAVTDGTYNWVPCTSGDSGGGSAEGAVLYTEQALNPEQKSQARANIGAADDADTEYLPGKNLFNIDTIVQGSWAVYNSGKIEYYPANQYIANYRRSDYIPVTGGKKYAYSGGHAYHEIGQYNLLSYAYYDNSKNFISGEMPNNSALGAFVLATPANAAYIIINFTGDNYKCNVQLEEGTVATAYEPYAAKEKYYKNNLVIKEEQVEKTDADLIHLPQKYDLVVGDTFELFYKGIMLCKDPYRYNILVSCDIGNAFSRKFVVTPAETGTHTLTVQAMDDFGNVIDEASTELVVSSKMTSPAEQVNVLCVGDSLTAGGQWVDEVYRRLTKTTSATQHNATAPTGDGLSNIAFVGKKTTANGAGYEGTGGWSYSSYLDTSNADNPFLYNGSIDFSAYCAELGVDVIDRCCILLGWNMATNTEAAFKEKAKAFVDLLIAHNPAVKITLIGIEIPSYDGLGSNYSVTSAYSKYRALQEFVFNLDKWNADIADAYPNNVSTLSIAGQFDTENGMPTTTEKVNVRSTKDNIVQNNGVHPANEGYYQIADAVYRKFTADNK